MHSLRWEEFFYRRLSRGLNTIKDLLQTEFIILKLKLVDRITIRKTTSSNSFIKINTKKKVFLCRTKSLLVYH